MAIKSDGARALHLILQAKGGVGKSTAARFLTEYLRTIGSNPVGFDLDPINPTFASVEALGARHCDIADGDAIDLRKFDAVVEDILAGTGDVVIDCGASTFSPMLSYIDQINLLTVLADAGYDVHLHTVISGGADLLDTVQGFSELAERYSGSAKLVVWLNPHNGPLDIKGSEFPDWPVTKKFNDRIAGYIALPPLHPQTSGPDLTDMLSKNLTFELAIANDSPLPAMARHRLRVVRDTIFERIAFIANAEQAQAG